jgi:hypothetical protein
MATTTNYGWDTPDDTDLVKDGAAAIRTLGSSVDTTTKNLNPQTTTGALAYRSATSNVNTALPIGSTGQVLTVASGVPSWATPAGGGKVLQVVSAVSTTSTTISTSTYTDANISATITPSSATSKILVLVSAKMFISGTNAVAAKWQLLRGATSIFNRASDGAGVWYASTSVNTVEFITNPSIVFLDSPSTTSATTYKIQAGLGFAGADVKFQRDSDPSSITLLEIGA